MTGKGQFRSRIHVAVVVACLLVSALVRVAAVASSRDFVLPLADVVGTPESVASVDGMPPTSDYDPLHILVSFAPDVSADDRARIHAEVGGNVVNQLRTIDLDVVVLPDDLNATQAVSLYAKLPGVAHASLNDYLISLSPPDNGDGFPNDPLFPEQWNLHNEGQSIEGYPLELKEDADIDAPEGWAHLDRIPHREKVRVAILDSGIQRDHPDLDDVPLAACAGATKLIGLVEEGNCDDVHGHGTWVAGIVAAETGNRNYVSGIAPDAELAVFKFYDVWPTRADGLAGIEWATDPERGDADIINMSWGTPECAPEYEEKRLLDIAHERGIFLVAASGNMQSCAAEGVAGFGQAPVYPSAYEFVLSVGGTNGSGEVWLQHDDPLMGTTCNDTVDILAPAEEIWSTWSKDSRLAPDSETRQDVGTSAAAPHVAAVAAEVLAVTKWSREQRVNLLRAALLESATEVVPHPERDPADCAGLGQVNLVGALKEAPKYGRLRSSL